MDKPYSITDFKIRREAVKDLKCLAGLDRGCSLTKILYVPKEEKDTESDTYTFRCAVFENARFEQALDWLKQEAMLPENETFHATGAGGLLFKTQISKKLGLNVMFVDEFISQIRGAQFLIREVDHESLCYPAAIPDLQIDDIERSEMMKQMEKDMSDRLKVNAGKQFPCIFYFLGSGGGILRLNEDGTASMLGGVGIAGKSFLGLAKCLLGTASYPEICDLARKGSRNNTDTQVWEVLQNDEHSKAYGKFPKDLPIFAFGKAVDYDRSLSEFSKEDLAASLVALTSLNIIRHAAALGNITQIGRVYIGGNLMQDEVFRQVSARFLQFFQKSNSAFSISFIKTGHTGAIGAMLSKPAGDELNILTPI